MASKPYLGGKARHQLIRSPERDTNNGFEFNSAGGLGSEMRQVNQRELQKEIEEEIAVGDDYDSRVNPQNMLETSKAEPDPNETCTSDFY